MCGAVRGRRPHVGTLQRPVTLNPSPFVSGSELLFAGDEW